MKIFVVEDEADLVLLDINLPYQDGYTICCVLIHKGLKINLLKATDAYGDKEVDLTKNELGILRLLIANKGNVIPRDAIIDELWQSDEFIDENTLNVNIVRLRKKLSKIGVLPCLPTKGNLSVLWAHPALVR